MADAGEVLSPWLLEKLQNGDCILFLGAGAAIGSTGSKGEKPLSGMKLRDLLCDKYLGGKHKDTALPRVAEFAKYESSLPDVQDCIRTAFHPLQPASFHKLIPLFRWFAIVTTNYDLIVERAYDAVAKRQQQLRPIIRDGDNFSAVLKDQNSLPYLKLHGCINTINDEGLPLILGSEEYAKHQRNRKRLFVHFADWARERPVIFVGYDISDPNILQILFDLTDMGIQRPTYAVIDPALDEIACRYWGAHKFVPAAITFEKFLLRVNDLIPENNRTLAALRDDNALTISTWFQTNLPPSSNLRRYLNEELEHIHPGMVSKGINPKAFYSGANLDWSAFQQDLDVKRPVSDDLILECVLDDKKNNGPAVFLIKGHAGSGITVALRRFAWDAARDFGARVLFLKEGGVLRSSLISEIGELAQERIVIVIDDALKHLADVSKLYKDAAAKRLELQIVIAARTNEWNLVSPDTDFPPISEEYELKDLSERDINSLLDKLSQHGALGELSKMSRPEQFAHFKFHSERQLMVALHEATSGKPFEEIAFHEYSHVLPPEARILYLDICTLHRLGVSVRAGLVSRVSGVTFGTFSNNFFQPLEHVVRTYFDSASRDYVYRSRHPLIAEFVFRQALPDPVERAAQITRIIRHMDTDYESDSIAFGQLIRGRVLSDLFADKALVRQIFDAALESGAPADYINHQNAVFELHHPHGSMRTAMQAILEADRLSVGRDRSIQHTKAMILRRLALESDHSLERDKYRTEAKLILRKLQESARLSHPYDTYGRLLLDELKDRVLSSGEVNASGNEELTSRSLAEIIRLIEECLSRGLQRFPGDDHLLALEADFAHLLEDEPRTVKSLEAAVRSNPGRPFIAVRLATTYRRVKRSDDALAVLRACLQLNPSSKECHLELAHILMDQGEFANRVEIQHHLKRSFTDGDANFDAQFWYARHQLVHGDLELGLAQFKKLADLRTAPSYKNRIRGMMLSQDGNSAIVSGYVKHVGHAYCFASSAELRFDVHIRESAFSEKDWGALEVESKIRFEVGFSLRGPAGLHAALIA
jgi:hypothetical protein